MNEDLLQIKKLILQYISMIGKEYSMSDVRNVVSMMARGKEIVEFSKKPTISFVVIDGVLYLPKEAYNFFSTLKEYDNYGVNLGEKRNVDDYLDTNTTYKGYIKHIIEGGLSVYDYFVESLLHETMHICGSEGGLPLEEGINELKTRELAQKNNIRIAAYGYSKEVEVAKRLQEIIGKDVMDELTFIPIIQRELFLTNKLGSEVAELYKLVSDKMFRLSFKYTNKVCEISNPYEKADLYDSIDYSEVYQIIDDFKNKKSNTI